MYDQMLEEIDRKLELLLARASTLQSSSGGFKGFYVFDPDCGIWTTAEFVHTILKHGFNPDGIDFAKAKAYLLSCRNPDGGWPFRAGGKSIVDITAWSCLALSHFEWCQELADGVRFILDGQRNEQGSIEDGWSLTAKERDRVYSTWIASYCLIRILRDHGASVCPPLEQRMKEALEGSKRFLLNSLQIHGWGQDIDHPPCSSSTAMALLTLFMQGADPRNFRSSAEYILRTAQDGYWSPEHDLVITSEGYELNQEWFTTAYCFRALIFFAEMDIISLEDIYLKFNRLTALADDEGFVRSHPSRTRDYAWTIPYLIDCLQKYKEFILSKKRDFKTFFKHMRDQEIQFKRTSLGESVSRDFPYPISNSYAEFEQEMDFHRKFQRLLQFYEIFIKYATIILLSSALARKTDKAALPPELGQMLQRPSLGTWKQIFLQLLEDGGFSQIIFPTTMADLVEKRKSFQSIELVGRNISQDLDRIVMLRNENTGHGAIRSIYEYKKMLDQENDEIFNLIDRLSFLGNLNYFLILDTEYDEFGEGDKYKIRIFNGLKIKDSSLETTRRLSPGQREDMIRYIYVQNKTTNDIVNLYPFVSYMFCEGCSKERFFLFNGKKDNGNITYLSFDCGHQTIRENGAHFEKRLASAGIDWA